MLLNVNHLEIGYGAVTAVKDVSFQVDAGQILSIVGANGAGKTTIINSIMGFVRSKKGVVQLDGQDVTGRSPRELARLGVAIVPEGRRVFPGLTVKENLEMGAVRLGRGKDKTSIDRVYELFPPLVALQNRLAWSLSGGEQQMLAIGRALMLRPRLILMDEPSLGLSPALVNRVMGAITNIRVEGVGIVLVEQNTRHALRIADAGLVLRVGEVIKTGTGESLLHDPAVEKAFLGSL
jgi:branched-chain amino acid transport system ATP-binding protein